MKHIKEFKSFERNDEGMRYCRVLKDHKNIIRGIYGYLSGNKIIFPFSFPKESAFNKDYVDLHPDIFRILGESERHGESLDDVREKITSYENLRDLLIKYGVHNTNIKLDGTVEVDGDVDFSGYKLKKIPIKFGRVTGNFICSNQELTSLEGCPIEVGGDFNCELNYLTSLEGAPIKVGGNFICYRNELITLKGSPREVGGCFYCQGNQLDTGAVNRFLRGDYNQENEGNYVRDPSNKITSLKGGPEIVHGDFDCGGNKLTSLEGGPKVVGGNFWCHYNELTDLEGAPSEFGGHFICQKNKLTSLEGCPKEVSGNFNCSENDLTTLKGSPIYVGGDFWCQNNKLINLEGSPREVSGNFDCSNQKITSLEGSPIYVGGDFNCSRNRLTTLKGAPMEVVGNFNCEDNYLTTLEGSPSRIGGNFRFYGNPIYIVYRLFPNYKSFMDSLDYNYLRGRNIDRRRFEEALDEAGGEIPESIPGYKYI
jgi:hypothetical protein